MKNYKCYEEQTGKKTRRVLIMFNDKGVTPITGSILLVIMVIFMASSIFIAANQISGEMPTQSPIGGTMEFEETSEGMLIKPTKIHEEVIVELNDEPITRIKASDVGKEVFVPTSPGAQLIMKTATGTGKVLWEKEIHKGKAGDFISYYTFESGNSGKVIDRSANNNTGQIHGDPEWISGEETGLRFNGDDHVEINDISAPINVKGFTIAVAYKQKEREDHDVSQLVEHRWNEEDEWFLETRVDGSGSHRVEYAVGYPDDSGWIWSGYEYGFDERHLAVGTYDGKKIQTLH